MDSRHDAQLLVRKILSGGDAVPAVLAVRSPEIVEVVAAVIMVLENSNAVTFVGGAKEALGVMLVNGPACEDVKVVMLASETLDDTAVLAVQTPKREELEMELAAGRIVEEAMVPLLPTPVREKFDAKLMTGFNVLLVPVSVWEKVEMRMLAVVFVVDVETLTVGSPEKATLDAVMSAENLGESVEVLS